MGTTEAVYFSFKRKNEKKMSEYINEVNCDKTLNGVIKIHRQAYDVSRRQKVKVIGDLLETACAKLSS